MNELATSLFDGQKIRLAPRDPEHDPEIEAQWTQDPEYLHNVEPGPALPHSPQFIKKRYEEDVKDKRHFVFALRTRADDRLIGFAALRWHEWTHQTAFLSLAIGKAEDRDRGYEAEALELMLRYAFMELNLHRVNAIVLEHNQAWLRLLERAGFQIEVRRREAIRHAGRRWDALHLGLLRKEWEEGPSRYE